MHFNPFIYSSYLAFLFPPIGRYVGVKFANTLPSSHVLSRLPPLRLLLRRLRAEHRHAVISFWEITRSLIRRLETEVEELRHRLSSDSSTPRPPTSSSVNLLRDTVDAIIVNQALLATDSSRTIEAICDLPMIWAEDILRRYRSFNPIHQNSLGCWIADLVPAHHNGYITINLRNTLAPNSNQKLEVQPWAHHLSIIAKGEGVKLRLTTNGEYQVYILPSYLYILYDILIMILDISSLS